MIVRQLTAMALVWILVVCALPTSARLQEPMRPHDPMLGLRTSHDCLACHNGLKTPSGEDVSIGSSWRASMMANSARDPYWQASVRREVIDHPESRREIEDECAACHMPMSRTAARAGGRPGEVFSHLAAGRRDTDAARVAADGVSCSLCHRIEADRLGTADSFTGGYVIRRASAEAGPSEYGPFAVDDGRVSLMRSATGASPTESTHVQQSELCATCHTLFTRALDARGQPVGSLPEQVPFLEWRHSAFREERSCQSCHMPVVRDPVPVASVLGEPREGVNRHSFVGGNFFMLNMLDRYRLALGVEAPSSELRASVSATLAQLASETARVAIEEARVTGNTMSFAVAVRNLTGHKLPTGYPSRRVWLHVTVRSAAGAALFESGAIGSTGAIRGNDHDEDSARFEPHHAEIREAGAVQIYESIMADAAGRPTTGLLFGTRFLKDNRLLPRGFDKATASPDVAVVGEAREDQDFRDDGDRVSYIVDLGGATGPFRVEVELRYQPISFRWAENLKAYQAEEPRRFVSYFEALAGQSSAVLASASAQF